MQILFPDMLLDSTGIVLYTQRGSPRLKGFHEQLSSPSLASCSVNLLEVAFAGMRIPLSNEEPLDLLCGCMRVVPRTHSSLTNAFFLFFIMRNGGTSMRQSQLLLPTMREAPRLRSDRQLRMVVGKLAGEGLVELKERAQGQIQTFAAEEAIAVVMKKRNRD